MCEQCMHLEYDEEMGEYVCHATIIMDEDDYGKVHYKDNSQCPFFKLGDEYTLIKKQK